MKKLLIIFICCFCLIGCGNKKNNKDLLLGEWSYNFSNWSSKNYEFNDNNIVRYFECHHLVIGEGCVDGSAVWIGKYKLQDNIIELSNFEIDINDSYNFTNNLSGPNEKLIVDFDNMYFCNRYEGLDCSQKFEKEID